MKQLFIFLSVVTGIAFGQITGDLQVSVTDPSAASVSSATVTIRNVDTGTTRTLTTDEAGRVRASQLETGRYSVQVARSGFETTSATSVVNSGSATTIQIELNVATQQQEVTVVGEIPTINSVNAQLQVNVETPDIRALPIAFSNQGVLQLATTAPGIVPVTSNNTFLGLGNYSSNGGRVRANNITIDGATATDISTTGGVATRTVPLDGVREVALITNQFTAEFGRNSSSQFQILTRSGTNQFHGTAFGFFKNSALASRDYFDRTGSSTPNKDNNWGATAGGAIIKDKLFYFGTYEQQKVRGLGTSRNTNVPTPEQAATAFPLAKSILSMYQVPLSASGVLAVNAPNKTDFKAFSGRVDANLSARDYLYARAGHQMTTDVSTSLVFSTASLPLNGARALGSPWNATVSETHIFSPSLINTFLASYERNNPEFIPIAPVLGPEIVITGGTNFGPANSFPQGRVQNTFQYQDAVTWTRGRHTVKFGGEVNRIQLNSYADAFTRGVVTYNSLSDFLIDKPFQLQQRFGTSMRGFRTWNHSLYAQDDFRVTRTLTVNLGFRLEVANGTTEVNNLLSNIDPTLTSTPIGGGGTGVLGAFYTGGSFYNTNYNPAPRFGFAWTPRGGKTVIRGGYGITYDFIYLNPITNGRTLPPLMYSLTLAQSGFTGNNSLARVLAGNSDFQVNGAASVGSFSSTQQNFGAVTYVDPNLRNPQVQQFSLTVERPIKNNWTVRVSYSGSKGNYLQRTQPLNFMQSGLYTPPTTQAQQDAAQAAGTYSTLNSRLSSSTAFPRTNRIDPRFNAVSAVTSGANSNYHSLQFSVSRRFTNGYMFNTAYTWSKSIDDVSDALSVLSNDNQAQQNPLDNRNNRAVSAFDITQRLVISHHFEPRIRVSNTFANHLLNGWQFAGIFQAQSGFPYLLRAGTVGGLADGTLLGGAGVQRPDLIGPFNLNWSPDSGGKNIDKTLGSGLALPLVGHFGTLGRNVARWNPLINSDMTLGRTFVVRRSENPVKLQIQAQVTNVFNNTTFSAPTAASSLTLSSKAAFGYYQGTELDTRRVLLVGRIIW